MAQDAGKGAELPSLHALKLSSTPPRPASPLWASSSAPPPPPHPDLDPAPRATSDDHPQRLPEPSTSKPTASRPSSPPQHPPPPADADSISYRAYQGEEDLEAITKLVDEELSEPYNLYTYRYFLDEWPHLCFFACSKGEPIGVVICKQEPHAKSSRSLPVESSVAGDEERGHEQARRPLMRGYLAMLSTTKAFRGRGVATHLLRLSLSVMLRPPPSLVNSLPPDHPSRQPVDEVVLETEADNAAALAFYSKMGFVREKRLHRFYLNGKDAYRLRLDLSVCREDRGGEAAS
ncbi:hypothetical protein JCM3775_004904 [Rhodotorula graminis]